MKLREISLTPKKALRGLTADARPEVSNTWFSISKFWFSFSKFGFLFLKLGFLRSGIWEFGATETLIFFFLNFNVRGRYKKD